MEADPLEGSLAMEKGVLLVRPSVSLASRSPVTLLSSLVLAAVFPEMVLGSLTMPTLMLIACLVVPPRSSVMETMKESLPLKSALGV